MNERESEFRNELESLINRHCRENASNTPDFILADFLASSLKAFDAAVNLREGWYGRAPMPPGAATAENAEGGES